MAIVQKRGKPDFFITLTMNIKCKEVMDLLEPGQSPYDRPDVVCRVFQMKKKELLNAIVKEGIFGKCTAYVSAIKLQKRGAPHCHILIWVKNFDKTAANIDGMISAEIPHKDDPLHEKVMEKMIHGPCSPEFKS